MYAFKQYFLTLMWPSCRYQPDGALEQRADTRERDYLTSEGGESDLTESESHLNMLKGGSSTLQAALWPPSSPSEHSSSVVKMSICVLGRPVNVGVFCSVTEDTRMWGLNFHPCPTVVIVCVLSYLTTYHISSILGTQVWVLVLLSMCLLLFSCCILLICRQPQTSKKVSFMVGSSQHFSFSTSPTLLNEAHVLFFPPITGSSPAFSSHCERICQHLPDVSAEWRHVDPFLRVDGCWWVSAAHLPFCYTPWELQNRKKPTDILGNVCLGLLFI